jgi:hypothetical protein
MNASNEILVYRPGGVSAFFIYKAGFMAAGFWAWLGFLAVRGGALSTWHMVATAGAVTMTLAGVMLAVRHALARHAAARHEQIMQTLVELSWQSFSSPSTEPSTNIPAPAPVKAVPDPTPVQCDGDAEVIRFQHESRPRPRR